MFLEILIKKAPQLTETAKDYLSQSRQYFCNMFIMKNKYFFEYCTILFSILEIKVNKILYTGCIDEFFDYCYGELEYRSVKFENEILNEENFQGNAVINYTGADVPYTRIIEHKHFEFGTQTKTVISREYSVEWRKGAEPYYPVNDEKNSELYAKYLALAEEHSNVIFGGRLGEYKYYDMDKVMRAALNTVKREQFLQHTTNKNTY